MRISDWSSDVCSSDLSTLFANQSYAAILARDATVALCRAKPSVRVDDRDVDLTEACGVIAAWDGTDSLDSRGSPLFREYWLRVGDRPDIFAIPFDARNPVATPRQQIGRASSRARVCQSVSISVVADALQNRNA